MARPKRFEFSEFEKNKLDLPGGCEFLKDFRFHSIVEYAVQGRIQRRIEVLPTHLRKAIKQAVLADPLKERCEKLERELNRVKRDRVQALRDLKDELNFDKEASLTALREEARQFESDFKKLKRDHEELTTKCQLLERNNAILMSNYRDPDREYSGQRSPRNIFNVADDGTKLRFPALPGGLPGLGKKSK